MQFEFSPKFHHHNRHMVVWNKTVLTKEIEQFSSSFHTKNKNEMFSNTPWKGAVFFWVIYMW